MTDTSDVKPWWQSRAIIGSLVAIFAVVARLLGYNLANADELALIEAITTIAGVAGSVVALYGRVKATKTISAS